MAGDPCIGLTDKLYWRPVTTMMWHCFTRSTRPDEARYVSLCERHQRDRSGGQACSRPPPMLRCGLCDGREAARRGWEECAP